MPTATPKHSSEDGEQRSPCPGRYGPPRLLRSVRPRPFRLCVRGCGLRRNVERDAMTEALGGTKWISLSMTQPAPPDSLVRGNAIVCQPLPHSWALDLRSARVCPSNLRDINAGGGLRQKPPSPRPAPMYAGQAGCFYRLVAYFAEALHATDARRTSRRSSGCYKSRQRRSMYGLVTIVCLIAIVAWVADQTLRDVQHIRRNWHRERP